MSAVRVAICGVRGRMGRQLATDLPSYAGLAILGGCDPQPLEGAPASEPFTVTPSLDELLALIQPDVVVDFTAAEAARANAGRALRGAIPVVIGTTGLSQGDLEEIDQLAREAGVGAVVAPNFAIGANLLMQFARIASQFFDAAEIIEIHHDAKADAPSGTALLIAEGMRQARGRPFAGDHVTKHVVQGARGALLDDLHIHSLRMQGFVATHEVIFGGPGQSLTIRHDSIGRESFVPGVAYAVTHVREHTGLVYGLDRLMNLGS